MVSWGFDESWENRESRANTKTSVEKIFPSSYDVYPHVDSLIDSCLSFLVLELASTTVAFKHPE